LIHPTETIKRSKNVSLRNLRKISAGQSPNTLQKPFLNAPMEGMGSVIVGPSRPKDFFQSTGGKPYGTLLGCEGVEGW